MPTTRANSSISGVTIRRLFGLIRPYWKQFVFGLMALGIGSGINLLFPVVIRSFFQETSVAQLSAQATTIAVLLVALFIIQGLSFYYRSYYFGTVGQQTVTSIRRQLYNVLIHKPIEFFDHTRAAELVSRLSSDALLLQDAVSVRISVFIRYSLQVLVGTALMFYISPTLTLCIVIIIPVLVGLSMVLGRRLRSLSKAQQKELGSSSAIAHETFDNSRIVKAFNQEAFETARYAASNEKVLSLGISRTATAAFFSSFVSFLLNCAIVGVLLYGIHLVGLGALALGDLLAFLLYGVIVAVSFAFLAGGYAEVVQSLGASERIFEILDSTGPQVSAGDSPVLPAKGHCEFRNVSFRYPSRPEVPVLQNASFEIPCGKVTAIVGPSGAGKSTIVNLLLGFYAPQSGSLTFDGKDITSLDVHHLREQIAIVPQEQVLFSATIAENLRYGRNTATQAELERACARTNMLDFIQSLPERWDTEVGERGMQLSTGQKQRLAIARALLRNPALLILDEATSALDSENEHLVQQSLSELMQGRTALVIAHRLSTIKNADQVLVLDRGTVVQRGTHEELSRQPGLYRQLVERQELAT